MRPGAVACFTFDNMDPAGDEAALARGYAALRRLLDAHGIRATFFVEGWNGIHRPAAVAEIVRCGHELGMHGWTHERWHALEPSTEEALAERATRALEHAAGGRPIGFRAPGGARSAATDAVLTRLGYHYDASLGDGMRPGRLPSGLVQIPFVWPGVDGFHYLRREPAAPTAVRDAWLATLARIADAGGLFLLVCHALVTGIDPARVAALDAVMRAARADPRVAIRTAGELASEL